MTRRKVIVARRRAQGEQPSRAVSASVLPGRGSLRAQMKLRGLASKHTRRGARVLFHTTMSHPTVLKHRRRAANRQARLSRRANRP